VSCLYGLNIETITVDMALAEPAAAVRARTGLRLRDASDAVDISSIIER
jgi:hypothetical protein